MARILVTGGTGFIGRHMVKKLLEEGHSVRCLVRDTKKITPLGSCEEIWESDVVDRRSLRGATENVDLVFHLAASDDKRVNVIGTKNVLGECLGRHIKKFIHFSTIDVYGNYCPAKEGKPISESDKCNPQTSYEITKFQGERVALSFYEEYGLPVVVLRPTMVYGPNRLKKGLIERSVVGAITPVIGDGTHTFNIVHVQDLIRAALSASKKGRAGEVYNIIGRDISWNDFIDYVAEKEGVHPKKVYIPYPVADISIRSLDVVYELLGKKSPIDPSQMERFSCARTFSGKKAEHELGYRPILDPFRN